MNVFRALIPCVLPYSGGENQGTTRENNRASCWFTGRGQGNDLRMTQRMGASASSSLASVGGDSLQAARLSSSGSPDPLGIIIRYL